MRCRANWNCSHVADRESQLFSLQQCLEDSTWSVPKGHRGEVNHPIPTDHGWVEVKHLVAAGLLPVGSRLHPRPGQWKSEEAVVLADGTMDVAGKVFQTPSGAGKHVKGAGTNGWAFWRLDDGRKLAEVRAVYRGEKPTPESSTATFDWSQLHAIVEVLPAGSWTADSDLADAVGTAAQPLGNHITSCLHCVNAHRVLTRDGQVAHTFRWVNPDDRRDPGQILRDEGIRSVNDRADSAARVTGDELINLVSVI